MRPEAGLQSISILLSVSNHSGTAIKILDFTSVQGKAAAEIIKGRARKMIQKTGMHNLYVRDLGLIIGTRSDTLKNLAP